MQCPSMATFSDDWKMQKAKYGFEIPLGFFQIPYFPFLFRSSIKTKNFSNFLHFNLFLLSSTCCSHYSMAMLEFGHEEFSVAWMSSYCMKPGAYSVGFFCWTVKLWEHKNNKWYLGGHTHKTNFLQSWSLVIPFVRPNIWRSFLTTWSYVFLDPSLPCASSTNLHCLTWLSLFIHTTWPYQLSLLSCSLLMVPLYTQFSSQITWHYPLGGASRLQFFQTFTYPL